MRLGLITGLQSEAAALDKRGRFALRPRCAGARHDAAERLARDLAAAGADVLVSIGLAGALSPAFDSGDLVVATKVVTQDEKFESSLSSKLSDQLKASFDALPRQPTEIVMFGSETAILTQSEKSRLSTDAGAGAVDMESIGVARAAKQAGLPFVVLRAIADRADQTIPAPAARAVQPDGHVTIAPVLAGLARRPTDIVDLVRLARASRIAHRSLESLAACLAAFETSAGKPS